MAIATGQLTISDLNETYIGVLSNDAHTVSTLADGTGGVFTSVVSTIKILLGSVDDTANWTVTATPVSGVTGTLSSKTYTVTNMTVDTGYVDITATKAGQVTIVKRFTITKSKQGITGGQGGKGDQGEATYTWIKYADSPTTGMNDSPTGKLYMGIAYNKTTVTKSLVYADYSWSLIKGADGTDGLPATQYYTWLKYADSPTTGMNDSPTGKSYIGLAYNKTTATESLTYADYTWSLIKGDKGTDGTNGVPVYTWVKYATSSTGAGINDSPTNMTYIGLAYNKLTSTPSITTTDYQWSLIKGDKGLDATTYYTWIKYADSPTTGMNDLPAGKTYIGIAHNKTTATESSVYADYTWSLIKGADGVTTYTWIKYADTPTTGMVDVPTGKAYIGLAYNKTTATESSVYADYAWSLIKGADGEKGTTGDTLYTWIKFADDASGNGMADTSDGKRFLGIAHNKPTATESSTTTDYVWSPLYDNVIVGGVNLLPNSLKVVMNPNDVGLGTSVLRNDETIPYYRITADPTKSISTYLMTYPQLGMTALNSTDIITCSVEVRSSVAGNAGLYGAPQFTLKANEWTKVSATMTYGSSVRPWGVVSTLTTIDYRKYKIEKGNVPTDWTPHELDNPIIVGGRNTALNSNFSTKSLDKWSNNGGVTYGVIDGKNVAVMGTASGIYQVVANETTIYTYSFLAKALDATTTANVGFLNMGVGASKIFSLTTAWARYSYTTTVPITSGQLIHLYSNGKSYYITDIKVEKGNVATDYTTAPEDRENLYTWIKYADSPTTGISDIPTNKDFIGVAYNKDSATKSSTYADYTWSLIKGDKGDEGIPSYLHIAYATSADGSVGFSTTVSTGKTFIGTYTDATVADSASYTAYSWSPLKGDKGDTGDDAISGVLTNDSHTISTDSAGNGGVYTNAVSTMKIYNGIVDDSANWAVTVAVSSVTGSLVGKTYTATNLTADTGYVDFTATRSGFASVVKRFTLTKSKQGATGGGGSAGLPATSYWLVNSVPAIAKSATAVYTPSTITFTGKSQTGTGTPANYAGRFIISDSVDGVTFVDRYTSVANEASKVYTPLANIKAVRVEYFLAGGVTTLLDEQIIPIVSEGAKGGDGTPSYLHIAYATSANGSVGFSTTVSTDKTYIGTYTDANVADSASYTAYSWSLIKGDKGDAGLINLVNNPHNSGNTTGWAVTTYGTTTFTDGRTLGVGNITTAGSAMATSSTFSIEPQKMYEFTVWLKQSVTKGTNYFGIYVYNTAMANIGTYSIANSTGVKTATLNTNGYFWNGTVTANVWQKHTGYIIPAGYDTSDVEKFRNLGDNVSLLFQFPADANFAQMRVLNYTNTVSTTLTMGLPMVKEVDVSVLEANRAKNLSEDSKGRLNNAVTTIDENGVSVKDGNFILEDSKTSTKYTVDAKTNLVKDSSFELIQHADTYHATYTGLHAIVNQNNSLSGWTRFGTAYARPSYSTNFDKNDIMFGNKQVVVSLGNYLFQDIPVISIVNTPYTVSFFAKSAREGNMTTGTPRLRIDWLSGSDQHIAISETHNFPIPSTFLGEKVRYAKTIVVPNILTNDTNPAMRMYIETTSATQWVEIDGVQVVQADKATSYIDESSLWEMVTGNQIADFMRVRSLEAESVSAMVQMYAERLDVMGNLNLYSQVDAGANTTTHAFTIGSNTSGLSLKMDANEVSTFNGAVGANLHLNPDGGNVVIGNNTANNITLDDTGRILLSNAKASNGYNFATIRDGLANHNDHMLIQNIMATVTLTSAQYQNYVDITFPTAFTSTVWVISNAQNSNSSSYISALYNVTSTGCRVYARHVDTTVGAISMQVQVVACGRKA